MLLGRELGFTVVEVNASDTRNKADAKTAAGIAGKTSNAVKELVRGGQGLGVVGCFGGGGQAGLSGSHEGWLGLAAASSLPPPAPPPHPPPSLLEAAPKQQHN